VGLSSCYETAAILQFSHTSVESKASTFNCPESLTAIRGGRFRRDRLSGERRINQIANRSNAIGNPKRHCRRAAQCFMHPAEVVERDVKAYGAKVCL